jgi:hypothetical protein
VQSCEDGVYQSEESEEWEEHGAGAVDALHTDMDQKFTSDQQVR